MLSLVHKFTIFTCVQNIIYNFALTITIITNLAEREADAAPAPEDVVSRRTFLYTGAPMLEVPAGHTATCITWFRTAAQALFMAALALEATCTMLTIVQAHWGEAEGEERREAGGYYKVWHWRTHHGFQPLLAS